MPIGLRPFDAQTVEWFQQALPPEGIRRRALARERGECCTSEWKSGRKEYWRCRVVSHSKVYFQHICHPLISLEEQRVGALRDMAEVLECLPDTLNDFDAGMRIRR